MTDVSFGEWLKRQRMGKGLTREQLADQIGCATVTLRKIESEERRPSEQIVTRIAEIFSIPKTERATFLKFARGDWTKAPAEQAIAIPNPSAETRNNLRAPLSSFIGRTTEIAAVREYLNTPATRLVTLLGPPGIGKTRLSLAVARESLQDFRDGVYFVELAPLEDANLVALTVAQTLGFSETPGKTPAQHISENIGDKHMLIVLDNVEHLLDATAALAADLLSACPRLTILTTSREPIRSPGEWLYPVPILTFPAEAEIPTLRPQDYFNFTALKLFHERARAVKPEFALTTNNLQTVTTICAHLDGLPLAIELLAARMHSLSADELLAQLTYAFVLSGEGMRAVPARQQTLQNAIGWSYRLLSETEQILFRRLSVFTGGWIADTAQTVCADESLPAAEIPRTLTQLVEKSLVTQQAEGGTMRYHMLVTIRQFAQDKLIESNEAESIRNRQLAFFLKLAEELESKLHGPTQAAALDHMEIEQDNFRAALRWGLDHDREAGVLLAGTMWLFWFMHSHFAEARQWYTEALSVSKNTSKLAQMRVLVGAGSNAMGRGDNENCARYSEQSLAIARDLGNTWGISMSLHHWGQVVMQSGDLDKAQMLLEEGLQIARTAEYWAVTLYILDDIGNLARRQGNFKQAEIYFNEMRDLADRYKEVWIKSYALACLSSLAYTQKEFTQARSLTKQTLALGFELNDKRQVSLMLEYLGLIALELGETPRAAQLFGAAKKLADVIGVLFAPNETKLNDLKSQLGQAKFETLFTAGQALSTEQAIALAMEA